MIKNIVFDIGNVILEGKPKDALKYIKLDEEAKKIIEHVVFDNSIRFELDFGKYDLNSYFNKIKEQLPEDLRAIAKEINSNSHKYRRFNIDIMEIIIKLSKYYKIYILSDNNIETINYLKTTDLNNYISGWCVSSMYNEVKSGKKLFDIFFKTNQLNPNECYFIDDKKSNIEIGEEFGMNGFTLDWQENKIEELIEDMKNHNINI